MCKKIICSKANGRVGGVLGRYWETHPLPRSAVVLADTSFQHFPIRGCLGWRAFPIVCFREHLHQTVDPGKCLGMCNPLTLFLKWWLLRRQLRSIPLQSNHISHRLLWIHTFNTTLFQCFLSQIKGKLGSFHLPKKWKGKTRQMLSSGYGKIDTKWVWSWCTPLICFYV